MDKIIEFLQDIEKIIMLCTNIVLAIYSFISTIRARRWRQTAEYINKNTVKVPGVSLYSVLSAPPGTASDIPAATSEPPAYLKPYFDKLKEEK